MSSFEAYARALDVVEQFLDRRRAGSVQTEAELLAAHPDLTGVLEAMLADLPAEATLSGTSARTPPWRGMPGEGDRLGGYRIERLLGQGGMGVVFLAHDERLGRNVALKLIRPERLGARAARERFWREAKLAARLEHPHICPVYEVGESDGIPFMAMRYLVGETLAARITRAQADAATDSTTSTRGAADAARRRVDEVLQVIEAAARALHFAHGLGVVHRDVKPANILIEPDGTPVVLDFGMALGGDDDLGLTMTGELAGTPLYMAPEQVTPGPRGVDHRADVYALGVSLYEAVTLVRPFGGQSMRELLDAIANDSAPPASRHNRALPRDLDVVLEKALEKDVARRYRSAAELADDLARVRAREPVHARRAGRIVRTKRWMQRNPLVVAFLVLAAVALGTTTFLYLRAEAARADFDLVAFVRRLDELRAAESGLYETWPEHASSMQTWLDEAERLRLDVEAVRPALVRLAGGGPSGPGAPGALPADAPPPADPARRFLFETLRTVVSRADALAEPGGSIPRVRRNLELLAQERQEQHAHAPAWQAAADAVRESPLYAGLELRPQFGLVPLGPDPATGLWEFAHPRSGAVPARDAEGRIAVGEATGIVFVLLPGGTFVMGAQAKDESAPNHDPDARLAEGKPHEVTLTPFFLGKHEVTQGQWMRLTGGSNPAEAQPGAGFRVPLDLAHPVEMVSWNACMRVLPQAGLTLPTEAQWEYAARGGTDTPWWTGAEVMSLAGRVNVADASAERAGAEWFELVALGLLPREQRGTFDDGFIWHAPVDALDGNGFGLFHVAGNVWEWCRDSYASYRTPADAGEGLRGKSDGQRVLRGGAFDHAPVHARSAMRRQDDPATRSGNVGVRAARRLW